MTIMEKIQQTLQKSDYSCNFNVDNSCATNKKIRNDNLITNDHQSHFTIELSENNTPAVPLLKEVINSPNQKNSYGRFSIYVLLVLHII